MQRAYTLQQNEQQQAAALEAEHRNLLAQLGAISLDKKRIKKMLPTVEEKQRALLRAIVERHGIKQYVGARLDGAGNVMVELPDEVITPEPAPPTGKTNGAATDHQEV